MLALDSKEFNYRGPALPHSSGIHHINPHISLSLINLIKIDNQALFQIVRIIKIVKFLYTFKNSSIKPACYKCVKFLYTSRNMLISKRIFIFDIL